MPGRFPISGSTVIITGASSGLGAEFARQLAPRAGCLVLAARRAERLTEVRGEALSLKPGLRVLAVACDLATDEGRAQLWEEMDAAGLRPDVLINNAGHGDYGAFVEAEEARLHSQIALNVTSLTLLTHAFLRRVGATAESPAAVLNVSSLAASTPVPDLTVYAATKSYVSSFTEGLAIELATRHVRVLAVCPGPTPTDFSQNARRADGTDTDRSGQGLLRQSPQKVVSEALRALECGRRRVHPGLGVALAAFLFEKMPRPVLRLLLTMRHRRSQQA